MNLQSNYLKSESANLYTNQSNCYYQISANSEEFQPKSLEQEIEQKLGAKASEEIFGSMMNQISQLFEEDDCLKQRSVSKKKSRKVLDKEQKTKVISKAYSVKKSQDKIGNQQENSCDSNSNEESKRDQLYLIKNPEGYHQQTPEIRTDTSSNDSYQKHRFTCQFCNKTFSSLGNKNDHERRHTNDRPYKCSQCFESYFRKYQLTKHEQKHKLGKVKGGRMSNYELYSRIFDQELFQLQDQLAGNVEPDEEPSSDYGSQIGSTISSPKSFRTIEAKSDLIKQAAAGGFAEYMQKSNSQHKQNNLKKQEGAEKKMIQEQYLIREKCQIRSGETLKLQNYNDIRSSSSKALDFLVEQKNENHLNEVLKSYLLAQSPSYQDEQYLYDSQYDHSQNDSLHKKYLNFN